MAYFVDLNWQDYEIENEVARIDESGEPVLDDEGKPVIDKVGTGVKMQVKPLTYEANQQMLAFAQKGRQAGGEDDMDQAFNTMNNPELPAFIKSIVPPHVQNLTGIELIPEGEKERRAATIDDVVEYGSFMTIALSIFTKLSLISNLSDEAKDTIKKNLPD